LDAALGSGERGSVLGGGGEEAAPAGRSVALPRCHVERVGSLIALLRGEQGSRAAACQPVGGLAVPPPHEEQPSRGAASPPPGQLVASRAPPRGEQGSCAAGSWWWR